MIVDIHAYLRKEKSLLKIAGKNPTIRANTPITTATIAVSTKDPSSCISYPHFIAFTVELLLT